MIDWTRGYECTWRFSQVDIATWASMRSVGNVTTASYSADSSTDSVETATLSCVLPYTEEMPSGWLRIEGLITQGASSSVITVATLNFTPETARWAGGMRTDSLRGVSGMQPAGESGTKMKDGVWAAKDSDGVRQISKLLGEYTPAPIVAYGTFSMPRQVVFDLDSTPLSVVKSMLNTAGWIARPNGFGEIELLPKPAKPIADFGSEDKGLFRSTASSDSNGRITYTRAWEPNLKVWDVFTASLPEIGLDGTYRVYSQRITCGNGISVEETVEEVL